MSASDRKLIAVFIGASQVKRRVASEVSKCRTKYIPIVGRSVNMADRTAYILYEYQLLSTTYILLNSTGMDAFSVCTLFAQSTAIYAIKRGTSET